MKTDTHLYTLTRNEFAKQEGKSRDVIKKRMKVGLYKDEYIFINGQYKFKSYLVKEGMGVNKDSSPPKLLEVSPSKKPKVNRGGHEVAVRKGRYPNVAFAQHNHMKKLIALRGKLTPEELSMVPTVELMVKQERRKQLQENLEVSRGRPNDLFKNYGCGVFNLGSNKGYGSKEYLGGAVDFNDRRFEPTNRGKPDKKKFYY